MAFYNKTSTASIKQYEVCRTSRWSGKNYEIKQNGSIILNTNRRTKLFKAPQIDIQTNDGRVLASAQSNTWNNGALLHLGNPDSSNKADWRALDWNFRGSKYAFVHNSRSYVWTRTRDKDLGASKWNGRDFKLVDEGSGQVLVVCRMDNSWLNKDVMARIDYYVQLEQELELLSLAAILSVEESITRGRQASAAGSAGAGA